MPKSSRKRSRRPSRMLPRRTVKRRSRKPRTKIHTFKGIINGGQLLIPASTATAITTWGGVYTVDMGELPIYSTLMSSFEFSRLNRLKFELLPRSNVNQMVATSSNPGSTIIVAVDEIPMTGTAGKASTWATQTSEDASISVAQAQASAFITPDYIRGIENSTEVETYKKITKSFVPACYTITTLAPSTFNSASVMAPAYEQLKKHWFTNNVSTSSATAASSPVFWGLMYCFTAAPLAVQTVAYDVRIHYSVSFKRLRGA